MKIIVIGATGATGKQIIHQLLQKVEVREVVALVRKPSFMPNPKLHEQVVDFNNLTAYAHLLVGDVAISCLGTTLKDAGSKEAQWTIDFDYPLTFAKLCKENNVPKFLLLSSVGANAKSSLFYSRLKGSLEQALMKCNFTELLIFRPAGLIRPNTERIGEKVFVKILNGLNTFGVLKNYKPIHVMDLAKAMITCIYKSYPKVTILELKDIMKL